MFIADELFYLENSSLILAHFKAKYNNINLIESDFISSTTLDYWHLWAVELCGRLVILELIAHEAN